MTLILNGTTGLSDVDGTAAAPAIRGTDADTGLYFPTANEVAAAAGGSAVWNASSTFGFKNRIINGEMDIDQRNAGASVTVNSSNNFYPVDRFACTGQTTDGVFTVQRSTTAPSGFTNSVIATVTTADASIGATQQYLVQQFIEGFNIADLGWGTAGAQSVTVSFWARSSLTGTFGGSIVNSGFNRSYPFTYTISAANTFEYKTVTIAGDTSGTWLTDNGVGLRLVFSLGAGSTYLGTAGSWSGSYFAGATGQTNLIGTNGATFYITGVQLEKGSVATSFDFRSYGTEFALCQRYYYVMSGFYIEGYANAGSLRAVTIPVNFPVTMRATPTRTVITAGSYNNIRGNSSAYAGLGLLGLNATFASASIESNAAGYTQCSNQTESMSAEL
jgi:hypothetical protein